MVDGRYARSTRPERAIPPDRHDTRREATDSQTAAARQAADLAAQEAAATREALERLQQAQERQAEALRELLEKRLPEPQAKRMGLVARVKAILWGDRKHGKL
jgi:DNA anti-recombination protein RmuC